MYYTYIVRCCDNSLYIGITNNLIRRLKEHYTKSRKCAKYTKYHSVVRLEMFYISNSRASASTLEYHLKKLSKSQKESLLTDEGHVIFNRVLKNILDSNMYRQAPFTIIKDYNELIFGKENLSID